jgi:chitinase
VDGDELATISAPPYRHEVFPARLGVGTFLIRAVAIFGGGKRVESEPATIEVRALSEVSDDVSVHELNVATIGDDNIVAVIYSPKPSDEFVAPADVFIKPGVISTAGEIREVEFIVNGKVVSALTQPPYEYTWRGASAGKYKLKIRAVTATGRSAESREVEVEVRP